jgi:pimeloyl-ACP methyl ester carboxylesterase
MAWSKQVLVRFLLLTVCSYPVANLRGASPHPDAAWKDKSPHKSSFVQENGIRLHYLDWGGKGETILLLAGMGVTPHIYDDLAPQFTMNFRVLGLTRRGLRPSDVPATGYDNATLVRDIAGFLDALSIRRVILIGHSMAGDEMTAFASRYPDRVRSLVYLDAAYDHSVFNELMGKDPLRNSPSKENLASFEDSKEWYVRNVGVWSDAVEAHARTANLQTDGTMRIDSMPPNVSKALLQEMAGFHPDYRAIRRSILAFYAVMPTHPGIRPDTPPELRKKAQAFWDQSWKPYQRHEIEKLKSSGATVRVVEMQGVQHLCFIRPQDQAVVVATIKGFLSGR